MAYRTLNDVIRDGMQLKVECLQCRHAERADPESAKAYVASCRKVAGLVADIGEPDISLERCADGITCPVCGATDLAIGVINPLNSNSEPSRE